tara:strand:+ start:1256 stop:1627 length:372 start_codon:yes stop_codon:yes gene_type:complete
MKKIKHKHNIGDIVKFKFLTGDIYTGKIMEKTFKDDAEKTPDYKIRVEENGGKSGFTTYPCMADSRIIEVVHTAIQNMKVMELAYREMMNKQRNAAAKEKKVETELSKAAKAQQDFTNGKLEK